MNGSALIAVAAGGAVGAVGRLTLLEALPADAGAWPWATLIANVVGSALLGYLTVRLADRRHRVFAALGPGLCGALTTFSTAQLEILLMLDAGRDGLAGLYLGTSVAACLVAATAGARAAREAAPA